MFARLSAVSSACASLGTSIGILGLAVACGSDTISPSTELDSSTPIDASTPDTSSELPDTSIPETSTPAEDAGPATGCSGAVDSFKTEVLAYIPCTATITDVTGKSTVTTFKSPTVSATPAGAPGGASCALGNAGGYSTANGFSITMPSAIGAGDFTVEVSVYQTAFSDPSDQQSEILVGDATYPPGPGTFPSFYSHKTKSKVQFISGATGKVGTDDSSALNVWASYAASRVSGTTYVFKNGALITSFADASNYTDKIAHVGHQKNGPYNAVMGSVGQIRITRVGRYTTSYTGCPGDFSSN